MTPLAVEFLAERSVSPLPRIVSAWERVGVRDPEQRMFCESMSLLQSLFGPLTFILSPRTCGERGIRVVYSISKGARACFRRQGVRLAGGECRRSFEPTCLMRRGFGVQTTDDWSLITDHFFFFTS